MVHPGPFQATNSSPSPSPSSDRPTSATSYLPKIAAGDLIATWAFAEPDREWSASASGARPPPRLAPASCSTASRRYVHDAQAADCPAGHRPGPGRADPVSGRPRTLRVSPSSRSSASIWPGGWPTCVSPFGRSRADGVRGRARARPAAGGRAAAAGGAGPAVRRAPTVNRPRASPSPCSTPRTAWRSAARSAPTRRLSTAWPTIGCGWKGRSPPPPTRPAPCSTVSTTPRIAARVAKAHVGKWSSAILHDCIQLHGGIGMTWEYDLHLYFRRADQQRGALRIAERAPAIPRRPGGSGGVMATDHHDRMSSVPRSGSGWPSTCP